MLGIFIGITLATQLSAESAVAARPDDLTTLARVFGELHHVRRMCEPQREAELWRERMKQMVRLEQPTAQLRRRLVGAFNDGFRSAESAHAQCDNDAEAFAESRAAVGAELAAKLAY